MRTQSADWLAVARALHDYLRRDMSDSDEQRKALYPVNFARHVPRYLPFLWAISRELATLYLQPPSRRFTQPDGSPLDEQTTSMLLAAYKRLRVNTIMRQAQRHLVALNNCTIWAQPHARSGLASLTIIPIHDQEVELGTPYATEEDDVEVWRYQIPIPVRGQVSPASLSAVAVITKGLAYWESGPPETRKRGLWSDVEGDVKGTFVNPFGTFPVVMLRGSDPAPGHWWSALPRDLLHTQRAVNHDNTDLGHVARLQSYGQPVAVGVTGGAEKAIHLGPETVVAMPPDGSFSFAKADPRLAEYGEVNSIYVSQVVAMNGMNPATFLKSSGITALAKQVELMDRESFRREHIEVMQTAEQRLYDVLRAVVNFQRGFELWPAARVEVEYREPIMPADPLHHVQALERAIALGQTGRVRARAVLDGVSPDEAVARIQADRDLDALAGFGALVMDEPSPSATEASDEVAPPLLDVPAGGDVQRAALNGAQVAELVAVIGEVAMGRLPALSARAVILAAYPVDQAAVDAMLAPLAGFAPAAPAAPTVPS